MKREVVIVFVIVILIGLAFMVSVDDESSELTGEAGSLRADIGNFLSGLFGIDNDDSGSDSNNQQAARDTLDRPAVETPDAVEAPNVQEVANLGPQLKLDNWENIGPGGGGRFEGPAISPHDSNFLLTSGDTGLNYKSLDNGETWEVMNLFYRSGKYARYRSPFTFHPEDEDLIFFADRDGFYKSLDKGETWNVVDGPWNDVLDYVHPDPKKFWRKPNYGPQVVGFSRYNPDFGLAAFDDYQQFDNLRLFITEDSGSTWRLLSWNPEDPSEKIKGVVFDERNLNRVFIATDKRFYITWNKGRNIWVRDHVAIDVSEPLRRDEFPIGDIVSFGGVARRGKNSACDRTSLLVTDTDNKVYNWNTCFGEFQIVGNPDAWPTEGNRKVRVNQIEVSHWNPNVAYASVTGVQRYPHDPSRDGLGGLYKTEDGGATWNPILFRNPEMPEYNIDRTWRTNGEPWGWHLEARGVAVSDGKPHKIFISDSVSNDEGATWKRIDSDSDSQDKAIAGEGMPIMRAWDYLKDGVYQYIAMTDFATWTSEDNGETWKYHAQSVNGRPLAKNIYKNVKIGNKIIGFGSEIHDLPSWTFLASNKEGKTGLGTGVMQISEDNGNNWQIFAPNGRGLPTVEDRGLLSTPFTDAIVLDDGSILVAALGKFGGFYKRSDEGDSFEPYSEGIPGYDHNDLSVDMDQEEYNEDTGVLTNIYGNRYGYRLGKTPEGKIFGVVTARISHPGYFPGQVYFLERDTWEPVLDSTALQNNIPYPVDFVVNPRNSNDMLITTFSTVTEPVVQGGLWRSLNGGRNWAKIYEGADVFRALFDNGRIIISTEHEGVQYTDDDGLTWNRVESLRVSRPSALIPEGDQLIVGSHAQGLWKSY